MPSDARAVAAREEHRRAFEDDDSAVRRRQRRDKYVRDLAAEGWSYAELSRAVGCSESLIAAIVKGRTGRKPR